MKRRPPLRLKAADMVATLYRQKFMKVGYSFNVHA